MAAAHKTCLRDYPLIVPLFLNGLAPMEMMEHELPLHRKSLLARKTGRYKDGKGVVATVSQTVESYRKQLIDETLLQYKDLTRTCVKETQMQRWSSYFRTRDINPEILKELV